MTAGLFPEAALEFDAVRDLLAARTRTEAGRRLALALRPSPDPDEVAARLAELGEAMDLDEARELPGLPALADVEPALGRLGIEGMALDGEALRALGAVAEAVDGLRRALGARRDPPPRLRAKVDAVPDLSPLRTALSGVFTAEGEVADGASPALAGLRTRLQVASARLVRRLEGYLDAPGAERWRRDDFVTTRNNRFVIPVRSDSRHAVDGIVHGTSGSGVTLFVEPLETVGLNNEIVRLRDEEAGEVARILERLTGVARDLRDGLAEAARVVAAFDAVAAAARLGRDFEARPAVLGDGLEIALEEARHILLEARLAPTGARAVPIDVRLEAGARVLVVSGPNTGGKTVALKTVGLAALMTQAGLPVPARRARLPVFRQVLADIGDQQSIAENLSTFSAHVRALVRMTGRVDSPALVLIDELGTGTDPEEGAALGIAIVEFFRARQALVLLTTHHNGLKAYAGTTAGVVSAAVEFDEARLAPTYRLVFGAAGRSGGLDIAARLGLADDIVARARALISEPARRAEAWIARLAELTAAAERERDAARAERAALAGERDRARADEAGRVAEIEERMESALAQARRRFDHALAETLQRLEGRAEKAWLRRAGEQASTAHARLIRAGAEAARGDPAAATAVPRPGDVVRIDLLRREGVVERVGGDGSLTVQVGEKRMVLAPGQVSLRRGTPPGSEPRAPSGSAPRSAGSAPRSAGRGDEAPADTPASSELHLLGERVEEALEHLERFLDRCLLTGAAQARIVHGHGTGRLKKAVRERLRGHAAVRDSRPGGPGEGGDGVTIVTLVD